MLTFVPVFSDVMANVCQWTLNLETDSIFNLLLVIANPLIIQDSC